jgi:hypothetical protein
MVGNNVLKEVEPEQRDLREDPTFVRNAGRKNVVEGRNAVGGYKQEVIVIEIVYISDLAAGVKFKFGIVSLKKYGIQNFGAHVVKITCQKLRVF